MIDIKIFLFIALILLTTKLFTIVMKRIHLPQVIGSLIAGVVLGPAIFGFIEPNDTISIIAEFGVILLLFSAGMETDFRQLRESLKSSLLISVLGIAASLGGGFALALAFGKPTFESFFIGVIIASMSTSITVEALNEMGKLKTKIGSVLMGASIFDDILVIVILAVTMSMGGSSFNIMTVGIVMLKIFVFFIFATGAGILVNKIFNYMYARFGEKRRLTIFAIAYCFLMAYLAEIFGLADITGAFIAGIAFCNTRCVEYLETKTHGLSYMLFTPVFLANIGIQTTFSGLTSSLILFTAILVIISILSKIIGCGLGAKLSGLTNRESVQIGVGMVARGEVSFIVSEKGIAAGFITSLIYPSVIVVVLVTVLITPILLKAAFGDKKEKTG